MRRAFETEFGTSVTYLESKFAWYGTTKPFDTLTQTFVACELGTFNAHHYRYAPGMSTFIVECDPATWARAGLDRASEADSRAICEQVFHATLHGHPLVSNRSVWRSFPFLWNDRWSYRNIVLIGDALRTAHYSIGSGTRLALEDALALTKALEAEPGDLPAALARYEADRRPIVEKLVAASRLSAAWYDRFPEHMRLEPLELAMSYLMRSGRIDEDRLRAMSPRFMASYDRRPPTRRRTEGAIVSDEAIRDHVPRFGPWHSGNRLRPAASASTPAPSCSTTWRRAAAAASPSPARRERAPMPSSAPTRPPSGPACSPSVCSVASACCCSSTTRRPILRPCSGRSAPASCRC